MDGVCLASVISRYLLMPFLMLRFTPFPVLRPQQVTVMLGNVWTLLYSIKRLGLHIINHFISIVWVCVIFYVWNMWTSPNNTFLCQVSSAAVLRYSFLQLVFSCMLLWVGEREPFAEYSTSTFKESCTAFKVSCSSLSSCTEEHSH